MPDFNSFVQTELPKRPFVESDGQLGQIPVRTGPGPKQLGWAWIADIIPPALGISVETYTFTSAILWTVTHNKNTVNLQASCWDDQGDQFFAKIRIVDPNTFEVHLTEAQAGKVSAIFLPT